MKKALYVLAALIVCVMAAVVTKGCMNGDGANGLRNLPEPAVIVIEVKRADGKYLTYVSDIHGNRCCFLTDRPYEVGQKVTIMKAME